MSHLSGKVAIVTGAAGMRGMGRAIAARLAADGADVAVVDHPEAFQDPPSGWKGLDSVVEEIQSAGGRGLAIKADIGAAADVEEIAGRVQRDLGRIDILVNNAAVRQVPNNTPVVDIEEADWERVIRINLTGQFLLSKAVARVMIGGGEGGKIVNISSIGGKKPLAGMGAYCAAKAALISLTQVMALELAKHKIYVNAICPGGIFTDHTVHYMDNLMKERGFNSVEEAKIWLSKNLTTGGAALGRQGKAEEIAAAVAFLASSESSYITGQAINVCGGMVFER
jgi:NAD(P)-dependent dehydrogenase (short-subunit alcohol dehydrogenase family)